MTATLAEPSAFVREPRQDRSRRTLERIVRGSHALLEEGGPEALTVGAIARRSRTSVGSFYARFEGKDELTRYLGELALGDALEDWEAALPLDRDRPLEEELARLSTALLDGFRTGAAARLVMLDTVEDPPPTRLARLSDRIMGDLASSFGKLRPGASGMSSASGMAARMVLATIRSLASDDGEPGGSPLDSGPAPHELARCIAGYLLEQALRARPSVPEREEETVRSDGPRPEEEGAGEPHRTAAERDLATAGPPKGSASAAAEKTGPAEAAEWEPDTFALGAEGAGSRPQPTDSQAEPAESQPEPTDSQPEPTESQPEPTGSQPEPPRASEAEPEPTEAPSAPTKPRDEAEPEDETEPEDEAKPEQPLEDDPFDIWG